MEVVGTCTKAGLDQAVEIIKESNSLIALGESSDICYSITQEQAFQANLGLA